jgi:hypothetical protein
MGAQTNNFLIVMPKYLRWFTGDFEFHNKFEKKQPVQVEIHSTPDGSLAINTSSTKNAKGHAHKHDAECERDLLYIIETIAANLGEGADKERTKLAEIARQIRHEKHTTGKVIHQMEYKKFGWLLDTSFFHASIKALASDCGSDDET